MPDGSTLGFSLKTAGGYWRVQFCGPDGKYVRAKTNVPATDSDQTARTAAARIIARTFAPQTKPSKPATAKTWADVVEELRAALVVNLQR